MKSIFSFLSILIVLFTNAQQGIDYSYSLSEISQLNSKQNIRFNNNSIIKYNTNKSFSITSKEIVLNINQEENPFIALTIKNDFDNNISFFYKVKTNNSWSNWKELTLDVHTNKLEQAFIANNTSAFQFKIEGNPTSEIVINSIDYRLFFPRSSSSNSQNTYTEIIQHKDLTCNCPIPNIEYRNDWCPSGNCPKDATPTATSFTHLVVHHSAGSNSSPDWAATVRSIWDYHTNSNGWDDVGYNYLIDPDGVIYEGRGNDVRGAHFSCMNGGAMGVCLLGNFNTTTPTTAMLNSLIELTGWKACELNKDPRDSSYFAAATIEITNLVGHRDGNNLPSSCTVTECPGNNVYDILGTVRNNIVNFAQNCTVSNTYSNIVILDMDATPSPIYVNEATQLNVDFKNIGDAAINENLSISFQIDGNEVGTTSFSNLNINETKNSILTPYTFNTVGTYRYCTYIDAASNELLTNNNSYCVDITVQSRPTTTGIQTLEASAFNIYPNPTKDKLFIEGETFTEITVYNPIGQILIQQNQSPIDVSHLENGIYYIKIKKAQLTFNTSFKKN